MLRTGDIIQEVPSDDPTDDPTGQLDLAPLFPPAHPGPEPDYDERQEQARIAQELFTRAPTDAIEKQQESIQATEAQELDGVSPDIEDPAND
jgi:hypothetical protein